MHKRMVTAFVLFIFVLDLILIRTVPSATAMANIYVYPEFVGRAPGSTFKVNLMISGARNVFGWQLTLGWNASVLDFVNATEGSFLKGIEDNPTQWFNKTYQDQVGNDTITLGCTRLGYVSGVDGSGVLATVAFRVEVEGETPLDLSETKLADSRPTPLPIEHTATDGFFSNIAEFPVARFSITPSIARIGETVIFDASASYDLDGFIVQYFWDFGDGTNSSMPDPVANHSYINSGIFFVTLTVFDNDGWHAHTSESVEVRAVFAYDVEIISVSESVQTANVGDVVTITVQVGNAGSNNLTSVTVRAFYDTTQIGAAQITSLNVGQTKNLTFAWDTTSVVAGKYRIKAVADPVPGEGDTTNNELLGGIVALGDVTRPVADAGSSRIVNEDSAVVLDGSASLDNVGITAYKWTFIDVITITLTGQTATYIFTTPRVYSITLRVTDAAGNWDEDTIIITVNDVTKPEAEAGQDKTANVNAPVSFDAGASTDNVGIVSYEWNFGDGTDGTGKTTTHAYANPEPYIVTLTVEDAAGNTETDTITVTILSDEVFPAWIIGAAIATIAVTAIVIAAFLLSRKRK